MEGVITFICASEFLILHFSWKTLVSFLSIFFKMLLIVAEMEVVAEGELGQDLHGVVIDVSLHVHLSFKIVS